MNEFEEESSADNHEEHDAPLIAILNDMAPSVKERERHLLRKFASDIFNSEYFLKDFMENRSLIPEAPKYIQEAFFRRMEQWTYWELSFDETTVSRFGYNRHNNAPPSPRTQPAAAGSQKCVDDTCTICAGQFLEDDWTWSLTCYHQYHVDCIREWLTKCPKDPPECSLCRRPVPSYMAAKLGVTAEERRATLAETEAAVVAQDSATAELMFAKALDQVKQNVSSTNKPPSLHPQVNRSATARVEDWRFDFQEAARDIDSAQRKAIEDRLSNAMGTFPQISRHGWLPHEKGANKYAICCPDGHARRFRKVALCKADMASRIMTVVDVVEMTDYCRKN